MIEKSSPAPSMPRGIGLSCLFQSCGEWQSAHAASLSTRYFPRAQRSANAPHFVGDERFAVSRSAKHNAALEFATRHRFRRRADEQRIVDRLRTERAEIADFVPERSQKRPYFFFVLKSCVVRANGYFQGPQHRAREIALSRAEVHSGATIFAHFTRPNW